MRRRTDKRNGGLSRIQEKNRKRILDAALREFSSFGYSGATIDRISHAAGMSKSNLLYYFPSKKAVYAAVLSSILDAWLNPFRMLDPDGDPAREIKAYVREKLTLSAKFPEASRLFANEILQGAPRITNVLEHDLKDLVAEKCAVIKKWIDAGKIRPIEPVHLIFTIWATTQHYADFAPQIRAVTGKDLNDPVFFAETERAISGLILTGLGLTVPDKVPA